LPHNAHGFPATNFWESAARSLTGVAVGGDAKISTDKLGVRQRYYGGTIAARNVANLTIPICAEAYGTTVKDWGDSLVLVVLGDGRKFLALWLGSDAAQAAYDKHLGKLAKAFDPDASDSERKRAQKGLWSRAETTASRVAKVRAAAAGQQKPKVIVFKGAGVGGGGAQAARAERHANLKFLFVLKASVEQAGNPNVIPPDFDEVAKRQVREAIR